MHLLILGGTIFLGRSLVEAALLRGHQVTLFNRGKHNPDLYPDVERVRGDRNADLSTLRHRAFDAVIDTCGYRPDQVAASADALGAIVEHYIFISSISVYRAFPPDHSVDEDAPRGEGSDGYGPAKARCEDVLLDALPGRVACVRPGLIVGPHDPTDRFTYWPRRIAHGGHVLAPGRPERHVQFIDVRDLGDWCVRLAESRTAGTFNAVSSPAALSMKGLLDTCAMVADAPTRVTWVPDADLLAAGVEPWTEIPLWIPETDPDHGGMLLADNRRATAAGLTCRPVVDTVRATLEWDRAQGAWQGDSPIRIAPLTEDREADILARYAPTEPGEDVLG